LEDGEDMEHARRIFHKNARKLVGQAISNARIAASNAYLKMYAGQELGRFRDGSTVYLTEDQYTFVSHVNFHFILILRC
jgi:hypothetical protein